MNIPEFIKTVQPNGTIDYQKTEDFILLKTQFIQTRIPTVTEEEILEQLEYIYSEDGEITLVGYLLKSFIYDEELDD